MLTETNIKKITQPKLPKMKNEVTKIYNEQGKTLPERVQMSEVPITNVFFYIYTGIFCHFHFYHDRRNDLSLSWFFFLSQFSFLKTSIFSVQCSESTDLWPVPHSTGKINLPAEFEGKIVRLKVFVVQWCFIMKLQNKVARGIRFRLHIWSL